MAVDAKQLAMENKALVACYVAAALAIGAYFYLVAPIAGGGSSSGRRGRRSRGRRGGGGGAQSFSAAVAKINGIKTNLDKLSKKVKAKDLYTRKDLAAFQERKELLEKKIDVLKELYAKQDEKIERWFEKWKDRDPEFGEYKTEYESRFKKLQEKYEALVGKGENLRLKPQEFKKADMRRAQKEFWFKEALLAALAEAKVDALASNIDVFVKGDPKDETRLYDLYQCEFKIRTPFRRLPVVVREILAAGLTFEVDEVTVDRVEFDVKKEKPGVVSINTTTPRKFFAEPYYKVNFPESVTEYKESEETLIPEPSVQASIKVSGYDFRISVEKKKEEEGAGE